MITSEYIQQAVKTQGSIQKELDGPDTDVLHALFGLQTETAELTDAFKRHWFYGAPLDMTNVREEIGDIFWYLAVLLDTIGTEPEPIMMANIAKLAKRYPDKFRTRDAVERDTGAEQQAIEDIF